MFRYRDIENRREIRRLDGLCVFLCLMTDLRSVSEVRSSFRQHGRFFEKNDLTPPKNEMTLSTPGKYEREILPWSGNGQTLALLRHAASGVAGAQDPHDL